MAEINPFSLINNPRLTPKLPDHSAVQKLLTDAHIQQSKNKAAAARNLATIRGSVGSGLVKNLHDPAAAWGPLGINIPGLAKTLGGRAALSNQLTKADTLSKIGSAGASMHKAGWKPSITGGLPMSIISGPQLATGESPVQRQVVSKDEIKTKRKQINGTDIGATDVTETRGKKFTGPSSVGQTKNLPSIIADKGRWSEISRPIKRTADYFKITPDQLIKKIVAGLNDGSVQLRGTKEIVIDGQPFTWLP
jgi:hypothetical protein